MLGAVPERAPCAGAAVILKVSGSPSPSEPERVKFTGTSSFVVMLRSFATGA